MSDAINCPCPKCGEDLENVAESFVCGSIAPAHDPDNTARLEVEIRCDECETGFRVFVPMPQIQEAASHV
jgi:hypothetical protein